MRDKLREMRVALWLLGYLVKDLALLQRFVERGWSYPWRNQCKHRFRIFVLRK